MAPGQPAPARPLAARLVLINDAYTRLWLGQAVSALGDIVFSTTLVLWVATDLAKGKSWAPAAVSAVLLAAGAAMLILGPIAGVFTDRRDGRRTMLRADQIRCVIAGALALVSFVPVRAIPVETWLILICAAVFALNAVGQFFTPARYTVIRDIVPGDANRAKAAGIAQATGGTLAIVGPPLAAPLLFTLGLQWALVFNAISYLVSFLAIRSVKTLPSPTRDAPSAQRASVLGDFAAGLRFFGGSKVLVALLSLAVIGQLGVGSLEALDVFFLTRNLHAPVQLYGYLGTAFGIGGIVGALLAGRVVARIGARATTWVGLLISGALLIGYSRQTSFPGGIVVILLFAVPMTMLNTAVAPLLMASAPREYLGRVVAVFYPVGQLAAMLATLLAGWLASSALRNLAVSVAGVGFGPIDAILAASGLLIIAAGLYGRSVLPGPGPEAQPEHAQTAGAEPADDADVPSAGSACDTEGISR